MIVYSEYSITCDVAYKCALCVVDLIHCQCLRCLAHLATGWIVIWHMLSAPATFLACLELHFVSANDDFWLVLYSVAMCMSHVSMKTMC